MKGTHTHAKLIKEINNSNLFLFPSLQNLIIVYLLIQSSNTNVILHFDLRMVLGCELIIFIATNRVLNSILSYRVGLEGLMVKFLHKIVDHLI